MLEENIREKKISNKGRRLEKVKLASANVQKQASPRWQHHIVKERQGGYFYRLKSSSLEAVVAVISSKLLLPFHLVKLYTCLSTAHVTSIYSACYYCYYWAYLLRLCLTQPMIDAIFQSYCLE